MFDSKGSQREAAAQVLLLKEEIATLQRRLDDMGLDGDCAYERAMGRVYVGLVAKRKQQLAALQPVG